MKGFTSKIVHSDRLDGVEHGGVAAGVFGGQVPDVVMAAVRLIPDLDERYDPHDDCC